MAAGSVNQTLEEGSLPTARHRAEGSTRLQFRPERPFWWALLSGRLSEMTALMARLQRAVGPQIDRAPLGPVGSVALLDAGTDWREIIAMSTPRECLLTQRWLSVVRLSDFVSRKTGDSDDKQHSWSRAYGLVAGPAGDVHGPGGIVDTSSARDTLLTNVGSTEVGADSGRLLYPTFGSYLSDRAEQSDKPMRGHERPTDETGSVDLGER